MIKIDYQAVPQEYLDFIDRMKGKIQKWYDSGEMGKGKTKIKVCDECKLIFRFLLQKDYLKKIMLLEAYELPLLIILVEEKFPVLKDEREGKLASHSDLYQCLMKAFYSLGYCDTQFPDYEITKALGLEACPYCNAEELIAQDLVEEGVKIRNSELDHFFPKDLHPYLAISLYNLVPSGQICNGAACKHNKDSFEKVLVNPFDLPDSEGVLFKLKIDDKGIASYNTFEQSCKIETYIMDSSLKVNASMFKIAARYALEWKQARMVWYLHKKCSAVGYRKEMERISRVLNETLTFDTWFESEMGIVPSDYNKRKLSKLSMDIWRQLEGMRTVNAI